MRPSLAPGARRRGTGPRLVISSTSSATAVPVSLRTPHPDVAAVAAGRTEALLAVMVTAFLP